MMKPDLFMRSLGRPNREQVVTTRPEDLITLQALYLTNGPAMAEILSKGAAQWRKDHPDLSPDDTIDLLYRAALSRAPTAAELATARHVLGEPITEAGVADLLWCVFMLPEFQVVK